MDERELALKYEKFIKNADLLHVRDAADLKVQQHTQKISKVTQSISTETITNGVFFTVAASLGFEGLGWAALGTGLVYLRLHQTYKRPWSKRAAVQQSQERYKTSNDPSEFNRDRLTHKQTIKFDDQSAYSSFFTAPNSPKHKSQSPFNAVYQKTGHITGAVFGGALASLIPVNPPYWASLSERCLSNSLIKSTDILSEPLPERAVIFRSNKALADKNIERWDYNRWGIIGSVVGCGINLKRVTTQSLARIPAIKEQSQSSFVKNNRPIVLMEDPKYEPPRSVLRTLFRTSRYTGVSQIPADHEERQESRDAEVESRKGDYKEIFWNAVGIGGAFEFTYVVVKNIESNLSNPDTYGLAALWAVTAWVSLDPLKHMLDDQKNITHRIEDANESIDAHDDASSFMKSIPA